MNNNQTFSTRLKELLAERSITVKDFAQSLKVDDTLVYCWLEGKNLPVLPTSVEIADYFSCSLDYLFARKDVDYFPVQSKKPMPRFSDALEAVFRASKKSEYRVAKDTNISRSRFYAWRHSDVVPFMHNLIHLADYFNVSLDALTGRDS